MKVSSEKNVIKLIIPDSVIVYLTLFKTDTSNPSTREIVSTEVC